MLLLLLACVPKEAPPPSDTDDVEGDDWADWLAGLPACEGLVSPRALPTWEDAEDAATRAWFDLADLVTANSELQTYGEEFGCPALAREGDTVTLTGPCETGWASFSGTWTASPTTHTLIDVVADVEGRAVRGDGTWTVEGGREVELATADLTYSLDDGPTLTYTGWSYSWDGSRQTAEGRIAEEGLGDWCLALETTSIDTCEEEPGDGWLLVTGDAAWAKVWDGSTRCDGCQVLLRDGVEVGEECG